MRLRLLGSLTIDGEITSLPRRDRVVLTRLAMASGRVVSRDTLIDALWGGEVPPSAEKVVQGVVLRLRKLLGPATIETVASGYRMVLPQSEIDVLAFASTAARSRELAAVGAVDRAAHTAGQALELWPDDGDGLLDDDGDGIDRADRLRLLDMRRTVEEEHLDLRLRVGGGGDMVERAAALVELDPHREQRWALLARAQYRVGRQADALRTIRRAQHTLRSELGLEPSHLLVDLEQQILQHDAGLDLALEPPGGVGDAVIDENPYRGLLSYDVDDHDVFFGRERTISDALARLAETGSLVLVGPSGSGKSSVLRAGVVARLRAEGRVAPIIELGTTSPRVASQLHGLPPDAVLVVDQLEELFTGSRAAVAAEELAALGTWSGSFAVALRSDHVGRLNDVPWLAALAERSLLLLRPPEPEDLRSAIVGPAAATGVRPEPGLVELVLRDVMGQPGALPLMSHALRSTWLGREGRTMTVDVYERAGGLHGAIGATADETYEHLSDDDRRRVRRLMVRLFDLSTGNRPTRLRVPMETAIDDIHGHDLIERLVAARLVVTGDDGVTVSHEALATAWPRLAEWLDDDRGAAQRRRHLTDAATAWDAMGRPDAELYRGGRLAAASEWRQDPEVGPSVLETSFLDASVALEQADRQRLETQLAARARTNRRLRALVAGVVTMLLVAGAVGAVALVQSRRASSAQTVAELAARDNRHQALLASGTSLLSSQRDLGVLLLAEADRLRPGIDTRSALLGAFVHTAGFLGYLHLDGPSPLVASVATGDDTLVVVDDRLAPWRVGVTGASTPIRLAEPLGAGSGLVATDALRTVVAIYRDPVEGPAFLEVFDLATLRSVMRAAVPDGRTSMAVAPGGAFVATGGGDDRGVELVRVSDGEQVGSFNVPAGSIQWRPYLSAAVTFDPDGVLYVATLDGALSRYATPELTPLDPLESVEGLVPTAGLEVIDDGAALIGHGWLNHPDPGVIVVRWDLTTGAVVWRATTQLPCEDMAYLADDDLVVCTNSFGTIELLDGATGSPAATIDAQLGRIGDVAALPDGRRYVTSSASETTLGVWDTTGAGPVTVVDNESARHDTPIWYSPDGASIYASAVPLSPFDVLSFGACDGVTDGSCFLAPDLLDGDSGAVIHPMDDIVGATWVGDDLAFIAESGDAGLWDLATDERVPVDISALSAFGNIVADDRVHDRFFLWVTDGTSYLLDVSDRRFVRAPLPAQPARAASFTGDGERLALVSGEELRLVDVISGDTVAGPINGFDSVDAVVDLVIAGDRTGRVHVLDADTLEPVQPPLDAGSGPVQEIEVTSDGSVVMARSGDAVRLFDVESGQLLGVPIPVARADPDEGAALRPDGSRVAITVDTGLAIWNLEQSALLAGACQLAGRDLTREEWATYIGELSPYHATCR